jgi:hypothetical protein
LADARHASEKLERIGRLFLMPHDHPRYPLTPEQVADPRARFTLS